MDQSILTSPPRTPAARVRSVFSWLAGIVCFGFLLSVIVLIAHQIIVPPPAPRVILLRNIPLPEGLKTQGAQIRWLQPPPNFLMALISSRLTPTLICSLSHTQAQCPMTRHSTTIVFILITLQTLPETATFWSLICKHRKLWGVCPFLRWPA